jgi:hypothetical protein
MNTFVDITFSTQRLLNYFASQSVRGRRGRDRMVVRLMTTYAINAYHHQRNPLGRGVLDTKWSAEALTTGLMISKGLLVHKAEISTKF